MRASAMRSLVGLAACLAATARASDRDPDLVPQWTNACCNQPAFSPEGRLLATHGSEGLALWDLEHGLMLRTIPFRNLLTRNGAAAFSPDGRYVASVAYQTLRPGAGPFSPDVWSAETGEPVGGGIWTTGADGSITNASIPWSPARLASWRTVRSQAGQRRVASYGGPGSLFTDDGRRVVVVHHGKEILGPADVEVHDTASGNVLMTMAILHGVFSVAVSADGRWIAVMNMNRELTVFDALSGKPSELHAPGPERAVLRFTALEMTEGAAFSENGEWLAVAAKDGVALFATRDMQQVQVLTTPKDEPARQLQFSPDGKRLAAGDRRVWEVPSGRELLTLTTTTRPVTALAISPDGTTLAAATSDELEPNSGASDNSVGLVRLWDLTRGGQPRTIARDRHTVRAICFTPDGRRLLTGRSEVVAGARDYYREGDVRLWAIASGEAALKLASSEPLVWSEDVAVSPDGRSFAAILSGKEIVFWDASGQEERTIEAEGASLRGLCVSPDGRRIAALADGRAVMVWSRKTGRVVNRFALPTDPLRPRRLDITLASPAWLPDGRHLVVGSDDGQVAAWDVLTGSLSWRLGTISPIPTALAVARDGSRVAAGGCDGRVQVWTGPHWKEQSLDGTSAGCITSIAFGPSGELAAGSEDGLVRVWDRTGPWRALLGTLCNTDDWLVVGSGRRYEGTPEAARRLVGLRNGTSVWSPSAFPGAALVEGLLPQLLGRP